jgi:SAM-dependent methyltransferase
VSDPLVLSFHGKPVDLRDLMGEILHSDRSADYSPWFFTYYADLAGQEYLSRYVRFLRKLLAFSGAEVDGLDLLDVGCGFGIMATIVALMGARVHGLDCHEGMIRTFRTYLDIVPHDLPVVPVVGDVAAMPYARSSFDLLLSHEAISHYPDVEGFVREAFRVLRPGGRLVISDSNNALNRRVVQQTREIWRAFEEGPSGVSVHGHTVEEPFVCQRAKLIAEAAPHLTANCVAQLARSTSGMWGKELRDVVASCPHGDPLPERADGDGPPVDPVHGCLIEALIQPRQLERALQRAGFRTRLRAYLGGARGGFLALVNDILTCGPLTPAVLRLSRAFRIVAVK